VKDNQNILQFACELAQRHRIRLELLHVVDPENSPSMPDAQMGIQYRLEALARNMKGLKKGVQAILLFGKPERVVWERAAKMKAKLIAIALNGSNTDRVQKRLALILAPRCACPVMTIPPDIRAEDAQSLSVPAARERGRVVRPRRLQWT
jgi:hypothetical protein